MKMRLFNLCLMLYLSVCAAVCNANQVTNPFFTGTTATATSWTSQNVGAGAAFNSPLSINAPAAVSAGGTTEFSSGCVNAPCLSFNTVTQTMAASTSGAQQSISTTVGVNYTISFWVYFSTVGTNLQNTQVVEIDVYWGPNKIYAGSGAAQSSAGWQQQTINLGVASSTSNKLTVMIRDDPDYSAITAIDIEPTLIISKTKAVLSDPVNGVTSPKAIPGATVQYCILITNGGYQTATSVVETDVLPTSVTYVTGSLKEFSATATVAATCANTTTPVTKSVLSGTTLTASLGTIPATGVNSSYAVTYSATIK
jgi:uncharacterized repeat protein (TIGR01451 family)